MEAESGELGGAEDVIVVARGREWGACEVSKHREHREHRVQRALSTESDGVCRES